MLHESVIRWRLATVRTSVTMPPAPSKEECLYIALQLEKGGYERIPAPKEVDLLAAAEFRLLVQQTLASYRPPPARRWRLGIANALLSNVRHLSGLEGMAVRFPPLASSARIADSRTRRRSPS